MLLALLLPLAGCVTVEPAYLANGMRVVRVRCELAWDGFTRCYETAGMICGPRGYALFDWDGRPWPRPYPDPAALNYDRLLSSSDLLVACRS